MNFPIGYENPAQAKPISTKNPQTGFVNPALGTQPSQNSLGNNSMQLQPQINRTNQITFSQMQNIAEAQLQDQNLTSGSNNVGNGTELQQRMANIAQIGETNQINPTLDHSNQFNSHIMQNQQLLMSQYNIQNPYLLMQQNYNQMIPNQDQIPQNYNRMPQSHEQLPQNYNNINSGLNQFHQGGMYPGSYAPGFQANQYGQMGFMGYQTGYGVDRRNYDQQLQGEFKNEGYNSYGQYGDQNSKDGGRRNQNN